MTLLESAKQALEALEELSGTGIFYKETPFQAYMRVRQMADLPISLLSQAIEQAEKQEPVAYWNGKDMFKRADEVQYVTNWTDYYYYPLYGEPRPCKTCESLARTVMMDQTSHDTAPPQRKWVGLTKAEMTEIWENTDSDWEMCMRVQAALNEKNT